MKLKIALITAMTALIVLLLQLDPVAPRPGGAKRAPPAPSEFLIIGAKLFDGQAWRGEQQVWVKDGLIQAVGSALDAPADLPRIDASGHSLLPGLIDAHVHTWGAARQQLLRFGVTSGLDMFSAAASLPAQRAERASLEPTDRADLWSAGSLVTAAGGHGTQFGLAIDTLDQAADAEAMVKRRVEAGSDFIKIVFDAGHAYGQAHLPTLDRARLQAAIEAAHGAGKLAVIHVSDRAAAAEAIARGADGLVHVFHDEVIDPARDAEWIDQLRARNGFVIATLSVIAGMSEPQHAEQLLHDPALAPFLDGSQKQGLGQRFPAAMQSSAHLRNAVANLQLLQQAGIAVLAGSDSPNPGTAHGASLHGELSLLVEAGLSPTEALVAATSAPAQAFALTDRGRIAAGLRADLLLVEGDPQTRIEDSRRIVRLWKNGREVARLQPGTEVAERRAPERLQFDFASADGWQVGMADSGWAASADDIMGGQSQARLDWQSEGADGEAPGALHLRGQIAAGAPYPFASAMLFLHPTPMQPVDARHWQTLRFQARGSAREFSLLLFSGDGQPPMPFRIGFGGSADWQTHEIDLGALAAVDRARLRAIGFAASAPEGEFELQIDQVVVQ